MLKTSTANVTVNLEINFDLLKNQKLELTKIVENTENKEQVEMLKGVINLLNNIQYQSLDQDGLDEVAVFG